jgi:hypothetical protein
MTMMLNANRYIYTVAMNDIIKSAIERLLGWPTVFLIACVVFRKQIANMLREVANVLGRINVFSVRHKDTTLEAKAQATETAKETSDPKLGVIGALATETDLEVKDIQAERKFLLSYGSQFKTVSMKAEAVRDEMDRLGFTPNDPETIEMLVRQVSFQQILTSFERLYRLIFGSQLRLLEYLNVNGMQDKSTAEFFYTLAFEANAEFYSDFSFDSWLAFLQSSLLIANDSPEGQVAISRFGQDFLIWIVVNQLSKDKAA